ncbi:MAG: DUF3795 domain-containing protein [Anaerofustis sp.]
MNRIISVCGTLCEECPQYPEECRGCPEIGGKVYWAGYVGAQICPIYECCVSEKQLAHCGRCEVFPCAKYFDLKDPEMTDDEHEESVIERLNRLREM